MLEIYTDIFAGAFISVYKNRNVLFKTLLIPILVSFLIEYIDYSHKGRVPDILISLSEWIIYIVIAVTTHRVILLGPSSVSILGIYIWGKKEIRFSLYLVALYCIFFAIKLSIALVFAFTESPYAFIIGPLAYLFLARLVFVLPGAAIDSKVTLGTSWKYTEGHTITMFVVLIVMPLLLFALSFIAQYLIANSAGFYISHSVLSVILIMQIAFISSAYHEITKRFSDKDQLKEIENKSSE